MAQELLIKGASTGSHKLHRVSCQPILDLIPIGELVEHPAIGFGRPFPPGQPIDLPPKPAIDL
ncbi:MAG: hypothetical protein KDA84_18135 [Planctomycetaceae bacterium]|nr:hypothetical protein [Planctomycetaceae bacterium]